MDLTRARWGVRWPGRLGARGRAVTIGPMRSPHLDRLERLRRSVLRGWDRISADPAERQVALTWIRAKPSSEPQVDLLWSEALEGRGPLAKWLDTGADSDRWPAEAISDSLPCHTVLASHPFAALPPWPLPRRDRA